MSRAMVKQLDDVYRQIKFEFDPDERGVQWQRACSTDNVEEIVALLLSRGYTIVDWDENV